MPPRQRTVRPRVLWALAFLLAALVTYLGSLVTAATGTAFALFALAAALVVTSTRVAVGAVVAGSRVVDHSQQTVLVWSLWSLALLLAAGIILLAAYGLFATPACRQQGCVGSIALAGLTLLLTALLGVASLVVGLGAGVAALTSAARLGKRGWLVTLLVYLLGSVTSTTLVYVLIGQRALSVDSPLVVLFVAPLLVPVITLLYSLSGRERRAHT